ncbi:MAG TPA: pyridoxal-phosphate dependent enzyme [Anaerolineae bacterium]|jgi:threonine dehydratase
MQAPTIQEIRTAASRLKPYIHRTPVFTSISLNRLCGAEIFLKCENLQKVGAFKIRGATNAVFSLTAEEAARGVATHSSGNHAAALAQAASWRGIKAYCVMPENAPDVKRRAVAGYGAEITLCQSNLQAREAGLQAVVDRTGATVVHGYNDLRVITGQATAGLELCEDVQRLDFVIAPVGGGGLISGTAIAVNAISPTTRVIAAEPELADDAYRSFLAGHIIPLTHTDTIADGLRTSLGELTFPIIQKYVSQVITVSEEAIITAMRIIWERTKLLVEPSGAVPLAAVLSNYDVFAGKRVGLILSGGNVDLDHLPWMK